MDKWEYKVTQMIEYDFNTVHLNDIGENSWELVSFFLDAATGKVTAVFKRKK